MFQVFRNAWKDPALRKKILFTLLIIVIFRFGAAIFVPFLEPSTIKQMMGEGTILNYLDVMTGGSLSNGTLFAMSITPYINASIIVQLLTVAIPALERLSKEGEEGRKKINKITKYVALGIGLFQAIAFYIGLRNTVNETTHKSAVLYTEGFDGVIAAITIVACFVAGASLIIWLGDQISQKGIGNGISMILFAGIISRVPDMVINLIKQISVAPQNWFFVPLILVIYVLMIAFVILMTNAERRIPVQYAKRVVGRKMYGGQTNHIPIKVAMAGVMPIIFAMSIMSLPATIGYFFGVTATSGHAFWSDFIALFSTNNVVYAILYFFLIIGFTYFYIAMQYNPVQIANDLKKNNGAIPGYRPGKPTSDFIHNSLSKVTLVGAIFLGIIAIFPIIFQNLTGITGLSLGGTTILIVVGVALETVRALESQMMMRHHKGFLE